MEIKLLKRKTYEEVQDPYFAEGQGAVDDYQYRSGDSQQEN